ncbi:aldehyde dehydrogenase domain-containing protein [Xylariaceae sp. FL0255]|nr:aldehyde dehydrogenase domain-containing protein [Xylariaceae sp. FL0255]
MCALDISKYPIPTQAFIGRKYVDTKGSGKQSLRSSVNDEVVTSELQWATAEDVDAAVAAAESALDVWAKDSNKTPTNSNGSEIFTCYGGLIDQFHGTVATPHEDGTLEYILRQPYGVVAGITPFNGPFLTFAMKEQTPPSTLFAASLTKAAGFPDGLIVVFTGGADAGSVLAAHMKIRMLSFTGSIGVGKKIQQAAAGSNLKKLTLELGGKSPVIVFDDADVCAGGTRMYDQEGVAQEMMFLMKGIVEYMASTLGASPLELTTMTSPLYNHRQKDVVMKYIEQGKTEATFLTGGSTVGEKGCYMQPTIFINPAKDAKVLNEEIFGPILTIVTFKVEAEALALANDTEYALAAYIWIKDLGRASRASKNIEAGSVCVNSAMIFDKGRPFGGWKQSGQGL